MIVVHHLNNSRAQRVLWLLEELDLPYEIRHYQRDPRTMLAPPALRAIHPLGKSPIITDGDATVAESGAIIEYVLDRYGKGRLRPDPSSPEYLRYRYFLHYAEGSFMPLILLQLAFSRLTKGPAPFFVKPILKGVGKQAQAYLAPQLKLHLSFVESELTGRRWLLGDTLSGADIQLSFAVEAASVGAGRGRYPEVERYLAQLRAEPAYQRALQKGGPFKLG